jgi:hypothetical protein
MTNETELHVNDRLFRALAISRLAEIGFSRISNSAEEMILDTICLAGGNLELSISCLEKYLMWLSSLDNEQIGEKYRSVMVLIEIQYIPHDDHEEIYESSDSIIVRDDNSMLLASSTIVEITQSKLTN